MSHDHKESTFEERGVDVPKTESYSQILDRSLWTRKEYLILYACVLAHAFAFQFEANMYYSVLGYVTAYFTATSLISVLPTILEILKAALVPFYIKIADVVGRAESISIAMFFYLTGFVVQGSSQSFVQLAIGQIFYGMGSTGVIVLSQVLIADTTRLIDRGVMFALWDLPSIASIFMAQSLIDPLSLPQGDEPLDKWRRAFLVMGIVSVIGAAILLTPLWRLQRKAKRMKNRRFERRSIGWLIQEFDAVGAVLLTAALSLTLLPMILAKSYEGNWKNSKIIGMFGAGVISIVLLVIWETRFTNRPIMSMRIWRNRTAFSALIIGFVFAIMSSVNYQYFTLYLVVARNLSFSDALLLERGYPIVWTICQLITALLMKTFNLCRPFVWIGIFVNVSGVGLMIPARAPTASASFVVISQAIAGAGAGIANVASAVAATAVVDKKDVAMVIGTQQVLASIGYAVGGALAGGVWTQYLPSRLAQHITTEYDEHLALNDPLKYIPSLPPKTKAQLVEAYGDSQMLMSVITCALASIACLCTFIMQPVDLLKDQPQLEEYQEAIDEGSDSYMIEKTS